MNAIDTVTRLAGLIVLLAGVTALLVACLRRVLVDPDLRLQFAEVIPERLFSRRTLWFVLLAFAVGGAVLFHPDLPVLDGNGAGEGGDR